MAQALTALEKSRIDASNPDLKGYSGTSEGFGTLLANQLGKAKVAYGQASFSTDDLTLAITATTLDGKTFTSVSSILITPVTDAAAYKAAASAGVVTITRPGSGTSGATFNYLIIGE